MHKDKASWLNTSEKFSFQRLQSNLLRDDEGFPFSWMKSKDWFCQFFCEIFLRAHWSKTEKETWSEFWENSIWLRRMPSQDLFHWLWAELESNPLLTRWRKSCICWNLLRWGGAYFDNKLEILQRRREIWKNNFPLGFAIFCYKGPFRFFGSNLSSSGSLFSSMNRNHSQRFEKRE